MPEAPLQHQTKPRFKLAALAKTPFLLTPVLLAACGGGDDGNSGTGPDSACYSDSNPAAVYLAQSHVTTPDYAVPGTQNERFRLVSNRDALFKAQITSADGNVPEVSLVLERNGQSQTLAMTAPETMPSRFNSCAGQVKHQSNDSFTATLPAAWVQPGLVVKLTVNGQETVYDNLAIGAPNPLRMNLFEIDIFNADATTLTQYPEGWDQEAAQKLPVSGFQVNRVQNIHFSAITVPPTGSSPATKITSLDDYETKNGVAFNQHNSTTHPWAVALRMAAGTHGGYRHTLSAVGYYFPSGTPKGLGGGYTLTAKRVSGALGILIHELGHALSLPHWGNNPSAYPYVGTLYGIPAPNIYGDVHVGPTWAYDARSARFIPPTVQDNAVSSATRGTYKKDPMQGGALGHQENGFLFGHFSDFSVHRINNSLHNLWVVYNPDLNGYARWNNTDQAYTDLQTNNGVHFPLPGQDNTEVYSVMAGVSSVTPEANIVYPPIGPYNAGVIQRFDPAVAQDRTDADAYFCPSNGCDVTLEVVQGGSTHHYMLPIGLDDTLEATNSKSFTTRAINLPVSEGIISSVKLYATPDAEQNGYPASPVLLTSWDSAD